MRAFVYSVASGLLASSASLFGKLAVSDVDWAYVGTQWTQIYRLVMFAAMIALNVSMWTLLTKALNLSKTTLRVTAINFAVNFLMSAFYGVLFFRESIGVLWFAGTALIIVGVLLIKGSKSYQKEE